jgi:hypothetical protein
VVTVIISGWDVWALTQMKVFYTLIKTLFHWSITSSEKHAVSAWQQHDNKNESHTQEGVGGFGIVTFLIRRSATIQIFHQFMLITYRV